MADSLEDVKFWLAIAMLAMSVLAIAVILISRLAMRSIAREKEIRQQQELDNQKKLPFNSVQVQERERERIASELHDALSSRLNVLRLSLYNEAQPVTESVALVDDALTIARNLSHELYPPLLAEAGLTDTLQDFVDPLAEQVNVHLHAHTKTAAETVDLNTQLHLFRIAQEGINNALRHANAATIDIVLHFGTSWTGLLIRDNGNGFDTDQASTGLGMRNIESRAQIIGSRYRVTSTPGKGTTITVLITT